MRRRSQVVAGQRFDTIGTHGHRLATWEVIETFRSKIDGVLYARLALVKDASEQRTIAVSALLDEHYYVESSAPAASDRE
jgi:hypothetical protein